jgi:hypothetical protein
VPTRSAVLAHARTLTSHPDPAVLAVAARYARDALDRRQRTFFARLLRRTLVLLASPAPVASPEAALEPPRLTLREERRIVVRGFLTLLATACVTGLGEWYILAHETGLVRDAAAVAALVFLVVVLALAASYAFYLARWILPGHPLIQLDARGVYHARLGYLLSWSDVTEIRLYPFRAASASPALLGSAPPVMVAFVPADPDAILRAMPGNPFRKWQQNGYSSPTAPPW